ncbi:PEP-CTERM sorting domain-containing protein [Leptolyngbyaceae cyanobacterium UHCC 1019]
MRHLHLFNSILASATLLTGLTPSAPAYAFSISGFATSGAQMGGIKVTANYLDGGSQTATWNPTGAQAGGAFGAGWSLTQVGDTYEFPWTLSTNTGFAQKITSLIINAIPGNTFFDIVLAPEKTVGSGNGIPFTVLSGQSPDAYAYSTDISGAGNDLKGTLSLSWNSGFTGQLSFLADTDSGKVDAPIQAAVPEPTTIAGVVLAVTGLTRLRRRLRLS